MWTQAQKCTLTCVWNNEPWGKKKKNPQSSSCLFHWPGCQCGPAQRNTEEVSEQAETSIAIRQSPHLLQIFQTDRQSEKPHAGGRRSYLPVLQGSQSPVLTLSHPSSPRLSSTFRFKHGTAHSGAQKPSYFTSRCTCCLLVKGSSSLSASKHLFFPPDLAPASSVLQDPCPSKSSLPALCNGLPTDMLPSKPSLGFRNQGHAFCIQSSAGPAGVWHIAALNKCHSSKADLLLTPHSPAHTGSSNSTILRLEPASIDWGHVLRREEHSPGFWSGFRLRSTHPLRNPSTGKCRCFSGSFTDSHCHN